jgi:hypothetical protein
MTDGAIDHEFDDAERPYVARVSEALSDIQTEPMAGGVAIDIVTRQAVFVRQRKYDDLEAHYGAEGYDLATYKMHPCSPASASTTRCMSARTSTGTPRLTESDRLNNAHALYSPIEILLAE